MYPAPLFSGIRPGVRILWRVMLAALALALLVPAAQAASGFVSASGVDYGPLRTVLILVHLFGLVVGMGSAVFLDVFMLRHLYHDPVSPAAVNVARIGGELAGAGFFALCISGIGFLVLYAGVSPDKLENPKMWAKVMVVALLLLNGMNIHEQILPQVEASIGRPLLAGRSLGDAFRFLLAGSLSVVGWAFALVLGTVREFNFVYSGQLFLGFFFASLIVALGAACVLHWWMRPAPFLPQAGRHSV